MSKDSVDRLAVLVSGEVLEGLKTFNVFIVKVYIKYWFTSPNAASAPTNDLNFINDLKAYDNKTIAKIALD